MHVQDELYASTFVANQNKYKGLLRRSKIKYYRDNCFRFFDYLYTMASSNDKPTQIMRTFHYIQVFIISFCPMSLIFWPQGTVLGKIINIIAISGTICPPLSSELAHVTITLLIYSLIILFLIYLFINIIFFHKYSKVNHLSINFLCIILNSFLPYLILYIGSNIGREISVISRYRSETETAEFKSNCCINLQIACISIGIFLVIFLFSIQTLFVTPTLTFRPQSLHFLSSVAVLSYLGSYFIISVLSFAAGGLNNYIVLFFTLIPLLIIHYYTYFCYEVWGTFEFRKTALAVLETISILLVTECFLLIFQVKMNEGFLLVIITFFIILNSTADSTFNSRIQKEYLTLCDRLLVSPNLFEKLTEKQVILLLRIGFEMGHKFCHTWKAYEYADEKFPNNRRIILLVLRYATIYPDEPLILRVIIKKVQSLKKHDIEMKYLLFQLQSLCQQRERGFSKSLKKMLSHIDNKNEKCRSQIKSIWNNVIQGNISEIENLSMQLKKNTEEITREYNQLFISYPNNLYVASSFGAFLSDIWCKEKESNALKRIYRLLRSGGKTRVERTYFFARNNFQNLPNEETHNRMKQEDEDERKNDHSSKSRNDNSSTISMSIDNFCDMSEAMTEEKTQQKHLETMIDSIHLPSLNYGPILIFSSISLLFPLISIIFGFFVMNKMNANVQGIKLIEKECLQEAIVGHISIVYYYHVMNSNRLISSFSNLLSLNSSSLAYLLSLAAYEEDLLNEINKIFPVLFKTGYFKKTLNFLFNDSIIFPKIYSNYSLGYTHHSYEFFITRISEGVLRAVPARALKLLNMTDFWTIVYSYPEFISQIDDFSEIQMKEMYTMIKGNYLTSLVVVMCFGFFALIVFLGITAFVFTKMNIEKELIFMSFKSLPKSSISATISKLNAQSGRHEVDEPTIVLTVQEERALRMLSINQSKTIAKNSDSYVLLILLLFVICVIFNLLIIVHSQKVIISDLPNMYSIMFEASKVHSAFISIILNLIRIVTYEQKQLPFNTLQKKEELVAKTSYLLDGISNRIHRFLHGSVLYDSNSKGLSGTDPSYINFFTKTPNVTVNRIPTDEKDFISLISVDNSISYAYFLLNDLFTQIISDKPSQTVDLKHESFALSIIWLFNTSFPSILEKVINTSVNSATSLHSDVKKYSLIIPMVVLNILIFFCGLALVPRFVKNAETAKWTMRLLLFCPPAVVLQSRPIIKILSNDFSREEQEDTTEMGKFYESLVAKVNDAAAFVDDEMVIRSINVNFMKMFGVDKLNTSLFDLFISPADKEYLLADFKKKLQGARLSETSPSFEGELFVTNNNGSEKVEPRLVHYSFIAININGHIQKKSDTSDIISFYTLVVEDVTTSMEMKENLLKEKAKIKNLLSINFPEKVLSAMMAKKPTFFHVQCASFLYLDFFEIRRISFNSEPSQILEKLNKLTEKVNKLLISYDALTRITSLGDGFFVAAGLFDPEMQPKRGARQAASFARAALSIINVHNRQLGLSASAGLSCGGPVVAGIVKRKVPTFSVLGTPIAMAVELAKQCAPARLQMTRRTFKMALGGEWRGEKEEAEVVFRKQNFETFILSAGDSQV